MGNTPWLPQEYKPGFDMEVRQRSLVLGAIAANLLQRRLTITDYVGNQSQSRSYELDLEHDFGPLENEHFFFYVGPNGLKRFKYENDRDSRRTLRRNRSANFMRYINMLSWTIEVSGGDTQASGD